jgi:hypothetical protein
MQQAHEPNEPEPLMQGGQYNRQCILLFDEIEVECVFLCKAVFSDRMIAASSTQGCYC